MTYSFDGQKDAERASMPSIILTLEGSGFQVTLLEDMAIQRLGVDATISKAGWRHSVEFKTDFQAHRTGNFFVETISVDTRGILGWAHTSTAQLLGLYIPGQGRLLLIPMWDLKARLPAWAKKYPERTCANDTYRSHGILVPLRELEAISVRTLEALRGEHEA